MPRSQEYGRRREFPYGAGNTERQYIQTAVVAKNYLEGFDPQISGTERAHHTFATDGIDVSGLKSLHSWNCSTGVESVGYQNRYERMRSVA
jgi:hypothetical protein